MAARVPRPSQAAPHKVVVEKIDLEFLHATYIAKSSETMFSELAVGFENFGWRPETRPAPRAQGPPRLAAGAGDRNAETLKDINILGSSAQFLRASFPLALTKYSQGSPIEMQAVPQVLFRRAPELLKPILQGCTSLFPAKREVKREVGKACQAWPGNQTS